MDSSSSTSSSEGGGALRWEPRPLPAWVALLVMALTLFGAEEAVRRLVPPPGGDILHRAREHARQAGSPGKPEILILGSCLPEQVMDMRGLHAALADRYELYQLGTATGTPLMWTVMLDAYVPRPEDVAAVVVPYGWGDLSRKTVPWESHLMQLARWRDLPLIVREECTDVDCAVEVSLQKVSWLYRYRAWLSQALRQRLAERLAERQAQGPGPAPAGRPGERYIAEGAGMWAAHEGPARDPFATLDTFLAHAEARGIRVFLTPLPTREDIAGQAGTHPGQAQTLARERASAEAHGARLVPFPAVPGLLPAHFEDEVHVGEPGRRLITAALAEALPRWIDEAPPPSP